LIKNIGIETTVGFVKLNLTLVYIKYSIVLAEVLEAATIKKAIPIKKQPFH
jgi:hypothetical protein